MHKRVRVVLRHDRDDELLGGGRVVPQHLADPEPSLAVEAAAQVDDAAGRLRRERRRDRVRHVRVPQQHRREQP
eukprot:6805533-Prymnesium_polylepis.1